MDKHYIIAWTSKTGDGAGRGRKLLTKEEADALAVELNREFPNFHHEPLNTAAAKSEERPSLETEERSTHEPPVAEEEKEMPPAEPSLKQG